MSHVISLWRDHAPRAISNSLVAVNPHLKPYGVNFLRVMMMIVNGEG